MINIKMLERLMEDITIINMKDGDNKNEKKL